MKVITSKELQMNRAAILKDVRAGQEYQVTFHHKPIAKIVPISSLKAKKLKPGSYEAVLESFKYTAPANNTPKDAYLDAIRWQHMKEKYGGRDR